MKGASPHRLLDERAAEADHRARELEGSRPAEEQMLDEEAIDEPSPGVGGEQRPRFPAAS
jgi:hypothetical protein